MRRLTAQDNAIVTNNSLFAVSGVLHITNYDQESSIAVSFNIHQLCNNSLLMTLIHCDVMYVKGEVMPEYCISAQNSIATTYLILRILRASIRQSNPWPCHWPDSNTCLYPIRGYSSESSSSRESKYSFLVGEGNYLLSATVNCDNCDIH